MRCTEKDWHRERPQCKNQHLFGHPEQFQVSQNLATEVSCIVDCHLWMQRMDFYAGNQEKNLSV